MTEVIEIIDDQPNNVIEVVVDSTEIVEVVQEGPPGPPGPPGAGAVELMDLHILDPTPHPAYDDLPSYTLIFENGLI